MHIYSLCRLEVREGDMKIYTSCRLEVQEGGTQIYTSCRPVVQESDTKIYIMSVDLLVMQLYTFVECRRDTIYICVYSYKSVWQLIYSGAVQLN